MPIYLSPYATLQLHLHNYFQGHCSGIEDYPFNSCTIETVTSFSSLWPIIPLMVDIIAYLEILR